MAAPYKVPYLTVEELAGRVDSFLNEHYNHREIPIKVEDIAEFSLGMNIVPTPGLHSEHGIDGFTSGDAKDMLIEETVHGDLRNENRYRFTIAHEIGHVVLHRRFYEGKSYYGPPGWARYLNELSEQDHARFEWQANCFAGMLLMPSPQLLAEARTAYEAVGRPKTNEVFEWEQMIEALAERFAVSSEAMHIRFNNENVRAALT